MNVCCLDEGSELLSVACKEEFGSRQGLRLVLFTWNCQRRMIMPDDLMRVQVDFGTL